MSLDVIQKLCDFVERQNSQNVVGITWHGGEPLATGIKRFRALLQPFEELRKSGKVKHYIQTNATLINLEWCKLFQEYDFAVGVSIDGPAWATQSRVDWGGKEVYDKIVEGIDLLKSQNIPFSVIAVVGSESFGRVEELFNYFYTLGCFYWGVNIEEQEGINEKVSKHSPKAVKRFWSELFRLWVERPEVEIREFVRYLDFARYAVTSFDDSWVDQFETDMFPTIAWDGTVYLLSPELAGMTSEKYADFIAGNILQVEMEEVLACAPALGYVADFRKGVMQCKAKCQYYAYCGGGQASNKFFENGDIATTQTNYCSNSIQFVFDGVTSVIQGDVTE